jgi:uncharacterized protein
LLILADYKNDMDKIIGREIEKKLLSEVLATDEAELVAVYGRRRVGKTFLIREFFQNQLVFEFSGKHNAGLQEQLQNFSLKIDEYTHSQFPSLAPQNWQEAFNRLKVYLEPIIATQKAVIFLDEFPWIDSPKSNFLSSFDYFWNDWASRKSNLKVVICGSAASWMIRKIVRNRGGLHNRITRKIRLLPFNLNETERFLQSRSINLDRFQLLEIYMAMGGVPHYLKELKKGESSIQTIDRLGFTKDGLLHEEFKNLFVSLFKNPNIHLQIMRLLARKTGGLTRNELIKQLNIPSGGTTTQIIEELEESGFVTGNHPFGKAKNEFLYKITDEYSLFYLRFIENNKFQSWSVIKNTPSWRSWSGLAYEAICLKHQEAIKKALGISGMYSDVSSWKFMGKDGAEGTQIDLLIDRSDKCINLCEIKFSESEFVIDKQYATKIQQKINIFKEQTNTRKTIFFTAISTYGLKQNEYKLRWVQNEVVMNDLFM